MEGVENFSNVESTLSVILSKSLGEKGFFLRRLDKEPGLAAWCFTLRFPDGEVLLGSHSKSQVELGLSLLTAAKQFNFFLGGPLKAVGLFTFEFITRNGRESFLARSRGIERATVTLPLFSIPMPVELYLPDVSPPQALSNQPYFVRIGRCNVFSCMISSLQVGMVLYLKEKIMEEINLPVKANLGTVNLTPDEIMGMRVGSTIQMKGLPSQVVLEIEGKKLALAELTTDEGEITLSVTEIFPDI